VTPCLTDAPSLRAALAGEVHIWNVNADDISDLLLESYRPLLTPDEYARNQRYVFERDRRRDLITRALVRTVLSTYAPEVEPRDWRFVAGRYGRPAIVAPCVEPPLHFNLSHTRSIVVCLVSVRPEVGVDVEDMERLSPTMEIAERFFSRGEVHALRSLPEAQRHERFFIYWTLKEAYIKARGMGLYLPLDQFTMHVAEGVAPRVSFEPRIVDDPATWQLMSRPFGEGHRLAAAIRRRGPDLPIRLLRTVPLGGEHVLERDESCPHLTD
jgi:4'-phosphopantetheinyl transferase